jgi:hypothetical protein
MNSEIARTTNPAIVTTTQDSSEENGGCWKKGDCDLLLWECLEGCGGHVKDDVVMWIRAVGTGKCTALRKLDHRLDKRILPAKSLP